MNATMLGDNQNNDPAHRGDSTMTRLSASPPALAFAAMLATLGVLPGRKNKHIACREGVSDGVAFTAVHVQIQHRSVKVLALNGKHRFRL